MGAKHEDANLILRLYELRRETVMRQARVWFGRDFHPTSAQYIMDVLHGENSASYRMVVSYWEMAATLVKHGAIDATMFQESNGEHIFVFAKLEPYLEEVRKLYGNPGLLTNLEAVVRATPNSEAILASMRERQARSAAAPATKRLS